MPTTCPIAGSAKPPAPSERRRHQEHYIGSIPQRARGQSFGFEFQRLRTSYIDSRDQEVADASPCGLSDLDNLDAPASRANRESEKFGGFLQCRSCICGRESRDECAVGCPGFGLVEANPLGMRAWRRGLVDSPVELEEISGWCDAEKENPNVKPAEVRELHFERALLGDDLADVVDEFPFSNRVGWDERDVGSHLFDRLMSKHPLDCSACALDPLLGVLVKPQYGNEESLAQRSITSETVSQEYPESPAVLSQWRFVGLRG